MRTGGRMEWRVFGLNRRRDWSKLSPEGVVLGRPGCRRRHQSQLALCTASSFLHLCSEPSAWWDQSTPTGGTGIRPHPPLRLLLSIADKTGGARGEPLKTTSWSFAWKKNKLLQSWFTYFNVPVQYFNLHIFCVCTEESGDSTSAPRS